MKGRLFLNVVIREGSAILELLAGEDESLLIGRNTFFVLNLGFNVFDGIRGLNVKSNGLPSESLDENLHTTSESEHQVERRFLLDIVIRKSSSVLQLFASEDEPLLVRWDSLLVLRIEMWRD